MKTWPDSRAIAHRNQRQSLFFFVRYRRGLDDLSIAGSLAPEGRGNTVVRRLCHALFYTEVKTMVCLYRRLNTSLDSHFLRSRARNSRDHRTFFLRYQSSSLACSQHKRVTKPTSPRFIPKTTQTGETPIASASRHHHYTHLHHLHPAHGATTPLNIAEQDLTN